MDGTHLGGGFASPATDAAEAFRQVLTAMARPGRICGISGALPPAPLSPAAGAVLLTLCDADTPIFLAGQADREDVRAWLAFHAGAPFAGPADCLFAVGTWDALMPLENFAIGTPEYPDRSATLIVEVDGFDGEPASLRGPGIRDAAQLVVPDRAVMRANHALCPLGLDFILTKGDKVAALPRSTEVL